MARAPVEPLPETFSPEAIIRAARDFDPPLGTLKAVNAMDVPKVVMQDLRINLLLTIATSTDDPEVAALMGQHVADLMPGRTQPAENEPHFKVSTAVITANPDKFAQVSLIGEMGKEYGRVLGEYGVEASTARKQFEYDREALEGTLGLLAVKPNLVEERLEIEAQRTARIRERISPRELERTMDVLERLARQVPEGDRTHIESAIDAVQSFRTERQARR